MAHSSHTNSAYMLLVHVGHCLYCTAVIG